MSVEVYDEDSGRDVNAEMLISVASFAIAAMDVHEQAELTIYLVDEPTIADLHERWLGLPGPTDVMSFPMDEITPGGGKPDAAQPGPAMLGELVLCPVFAGRQAQRAGHDLGHELALLTVHGVLHVLGYNHVEPDEEQHMFALQNDILHSWYEDLARQGIQYQPRPNNVGAFPSASDRKLLDDLLTREER
ncbi:MAG: rRNA maturation RNase YbeY [Corynebacterium sp.]|nr:rRNA maturation RNase YbeY [Corynebacterium sp.]